MSPSRQVLRGRRLQLGPGLRWLGRGAGLARRLLWPLWGDLVLRLWTPYADWRVHRLQRLQRALRGRLILSAGARADAEGSALPSLEQERVALLLMSSEVGRKIVQWKLQLSRRKRVHRERAATRWLGAAMDELEQEVAPTGVEGTLVGLRSEAELLRLRARSERLH